MSEHTAEVQYLMRSMIGLAGLTPDLIQALVILHSLSSDHSQLIQQIKAIDLRDFTAAEITRLVNGGLQPKTVAAVAGAKRKSKNFQHYPEASRQG